MDSGSAAMPRRRPHRQGPRPALTAGNVVHFVIAVFFLWPIFLVVAAIWSLGDAVNFVRYSVEACISSTVWFGRWMKELCASAVMHRNSPEMLRLKGQRRAFGHEARKDWANAGRALMGVGRAWSRTFGLGGLFASLEERVQRANQDWRRFVVTAPTGYAPEQFPQQYEVVDELPPGGSSARLYVVRRRADGRNGPLFVLKYFDLRGGGNLESVVRESHAAELARRLGLIIESSLGKQAFWYVMPFYHGETLTKGVLRNIKQAREGGPRNLAEHQRLSLGYVHQLLQIIAQYHEAGVFHKDIKPDNLIVNGERIYLVDIGLMTPLSSMAQLTTHGTEYFRDPEMVKLALEGREVREVNAAKFDIYSIGAVLYFALSGEFPTAGALSRLPDEVPLAAQWVVNRAMTGMAQRYDSARAMLTDVDFLSWAAAGGTLDQVKPADLPSFRGMPVPPHLQAPAQQVSNDTNWRRKLASTPGGYGAWYSAPAYHQRGFGLRKAVAVVFMAAGLGTVCVVGFAAVKGIQREHQAAKAPPMALADTLPADYQKLRPLYAQIDRDLADGIETETQLYRDAVPRLELAPTLVRGVQELDRRLASALADGIRRSGDSKAAGNVATPAVVFVNAETDAVDRELADGLARELRLEAARLGLGDNVLASGPDAEALAATLDLHDPLAMHRELGAAAATDGKAPPLLITFTLERGERHREVHLRAVYPGREVRSVVPFTEAP